MYLNLSLLLSRKKCHGATSDLRVGAKDSRPNFPFHVPHRGRPGSKLQLSTGLCLLKQPIVLECNEHQHKWWRLAYGSLYDIRHESLRACWICQVLSLRDSHPSFPLITGPDNERNRSAERKLSKKRNTNNSITALQTRGWTHYQTCHIAAISSRIETKIHCPSHCRS